MTKQMFLDLVGEAVFMEIESVESMKEYEQEDSKGFVAEMVSGEKYKITISSQA